MTDYSQLLVNTRLPRYTWYETTAIFFRVGAFSKNKKMSWEKQRALIMWPG